MAPRPDPIDPNKEINGNIPPVFPNQALNSSQPEDLSPNVVDEPYVNPEQIATSGLSETSASYESTNSYLNPTTPVQEQTGSASIAYAPNTPNFGPEEVAVSTQDELLQPAGNVGSIQNSNPNSESNSSSHKPKRSFKKAFVIGVPILLLLIIIGLVGFFVMQSGKTGKEALKSFSDANSGVSSQSNSLSTEISRLTYGAEQATNIEQVAKDYDEALKKFEEATANLKSDKAELKLAAEGYALNLKNFKEATVVLAVENAKIRTEFKKVEAVTFDNAMSTNLAAYTSEIDRISGEYAKISQLLKDVELTNPKAKELRDAYVAYLIQLQSVLKEIKTAVINFDSQAIAAAQTKAEQLDKDNAATAKEKEVDNLLGLNSEARKKLETARQRLNEEISKANS